jgi:hypothetical protein
MNVTFKRTGERRYGVFVERNKAPAMVMHPAPGYHEFLPHDLLHFVAEAEWQIDGAVFGQLAAGGDAGRFGPSTRSSLASGVAAANGCASVTEAVAVPSCSPTLSNQHGTRAAGRRRCPRTGTSA